MDSPRTHKASPHAEPWCRNLLHTFDELLEHVRELDRRARVPEERPERLLEDAYLTVCGLSQVVDDFVHRGFLGLEARLDVASSRPQKLDKYLELVPGNVAEALRKLTARGLVRIVARAIDATVAARVKLRAALRERRLLWLADALHGFAAELGFLVASEADGSAHALADILGRLRDDLARSGVPERLRLRVLRVPSCFKDFDLHPEDCRELVRRFAENCRDRCGPTTVVGIRTSGSYLAPLCTGYLARIGFDDVATTTMRQKVPLFAYERRLLRRRGRRGVVLVVDDPPVTGGTFRQAIRALGRLGIPPGHIVPLIPAEPDSPFAREHREVSRAVVLPKEEWWIRRAITDPGLSGRIPNGGGRWRGDHVPKVQVLALPPTGPDRTADAARTFGCRGSRCHEKVRLVATANGDAGGGRCVAVAKGAGLGWFEDHVRDTAEALAGFVPEGSVAGGILLTRWVDGPSLADRPDACGEALVRSVGRYVAARARKLPIRSGVAGDLEDRDTGWHLLAQCFARSYSLLAPFAHARLRAQLAAVSRAAPRAAVDGRMGPAEWIVPIRGGAPVKVDFEEHDFDHLDLGVFDPVFDLAAFVLENRLSPELEDILVAEYVDHSQDWGARRRLPHYKLLVGVSRQNELRLVLASGGSVSLGFGEGVGRNTVAIAKTEAERWLSSAANAWLAHAVGGDEPPSSSAGKLFVVDVDGVLEDGALGFSATTPAGVAAIRALKRHGFEPVLATGRSLGEVTDRCRRFRLRAGVAEHGSAAWILGETLCLASEDELEQLGRLRDIVSRTENAIVDPAYEHSLRVFQCRGALRRAMPLEWMCGLLRANGLDRLRVIAGEDQLDVVGSECNKGRAVLLLRDRLGACELHAAGDTAEDVSMLEVADRAYAPANVRPDVVAAMRREALFVARHRRQRGLLEIAQVAAHGRRRPCPACAPEPAAEEDATLLRVFAIRDRSRVGRLRDVVGRGALRDFLVSQ